jgi:hypothetical protein
MHILTYQNVNSRYAFTYKDLTNAGLVNDNEVGTLIAGRNNAKNIVCGWIAELLCLTVDRNNSRQMGTRMQKQKKHTHMQSVYTHTRDYTECSRLTCALRGVVASFSARTDIQTLVSFAVVMCVLVDLNMILVTFAGAAMPADLGADGSDVSNMITGCRANGCWGVMAQLLTIPMLSTFCFTMLYEMLLHICEIARDPFNTAYSLDYVNPDQLLVQSEQSSFHLLKPKRGDMGMLSLIIQEQEERQKGAPHQHTHTRAPQEEQHDGEAPKEEDDCPEFDEFNMLVQKPAAPADALDVKAKWKLAVRRAKAVAAFGGRA